jgi:hypothetical protein
MKPLIEKVLQDVDPDIAEAMRQKDEGHGGYEAWEYLRNPVDTIINWQRMRWDRPVISGISGSCSTGHDFDLNAT